MPEDTVNAAAQDAQTNETQTGANELGPQLDAGADDANAPAPHAPTESDYAAPALSGAQSSGDAGNGLLKTSIDSSSTSGINLSKPEDYANVADGGGAAIGYSSDGSFRIEDAARKMVVTNGVELAEKALENHKAKVIADCKAVPVGNTELEETLIEHIEAWLEVGKVRFEHLLTGMANSTAEAVRYLEEALVHLKDHVTQHSTSN